MNRLLNLVFGLILAISLFACPAKKAGNPSKPIVGSHVTWQTLPALLVDLNQNYHKNCNVTEIKPLRILAMDPPEMAGNKVFNAGTAWQETLVFDICGKETTHKVDFSMVAIGNHTALSVKVGPPVSPTSAE